MPARKSRPIDPWAAMDALIKYSKRPDGPEWFTRQQFQDRYCMTCSGACSKLRKMVRAGLLEEWTGYIPTIKATGCMYRLKSGKGAM